MRLPKGPGIIESMQEISLSAITRYRECPRWYEFIWVRKTPAPMVTLTDFAARQYFALVRWMEENRGDEISFEAIESRLKQDWTDNWDPRIDRLRDDYSEKQMKKITISSVRVAYQFFRNHASWTCLEPFSILKHRLPGFREIFFRHPIHGAYRDDTGHLVCIRHRFGPVRPEFEPVPPASMADAWIISQVVKQTPAKVVIVYPWRDQVTVESLDEKDPGTWIREIAGLASLICGERSFPPHPGNRCLACPYQTVCDAVSGPAQPIDFHGLHDPKIRITEYYLDLLDRHDRIHTDLAEAHAVLETRARKQDLSVFNDINGEPALDVCRSYQLPRPGSRRRKDLENLLDSAGYSGKIRADAIMEWIGTARPAPEWIQTITKLMPCRIKIKLRKQI